MWVRKRTSGSVGASGAEVKTRLSLYSGGLLGEDRASHTPPLVHSTGSSLLTLLGPQPHAGYGVEQN